MLPNDELVQDLRGEIARGRVLAVVGAGVSIGATGGHPHASWTGLIESGVERCLAFARPLPDGWEDRIRGEIGSGDLDDLLSAAEKVSRKLGAPRGGEFQRWLRDTVGCLPLKDRTVLEALRDLKIPLATTNYDRLVEEVTGLHPVTWRDGGKVERVVRGEEWGVLHLHGFWEEPESVVFGIRSYDEVTSNPHAQAVLRALRTLRTLLFIGCGEGLADPNFGALLRWSREVFRESEARHYRLCLDGEVEQVQAMHPLEERLFALPYGPKHSDLGLFLRSLALAPAATVATLSAAVAGPISTTVRLPPPPRCFGRVDEVDELARVVCAPAPAPVPILGGPGAGKTTISIAALHGVRVVARFGERRYFVRCEGSTSRDALASEIVQAVGLEPGPNSEARLFRELNQGPALLVLDNIETPWERDTAAVEDLLARFGAIEGLALVASIRGEQRPVGPRWREAIHVGPLELEAARETFLALAGESFRKEPRLNQLLEAVDRLPLAVTLLACQAEGEPDLSGLWKRWNIERIALLRRGEGHERLTDLEVSLELSIQGKRMTDPARRLLSLLGLLPDGLARDDLTVLLPDQGAAAAATLRQVGLAVPHDPRVRALAPVREHVQRRYPPRAADLDLAIDHYIRLAELGKKVGWEGGAEAVETLAPETGNLNGMVLRGLERPDPTPAVEAALALGKLYRFSGIGPPRVLEEAQSLMAARGRIDLEARCAARLGDIALYRSDHERARELYQQALALFQKLNDSLGEANCIRNLGSIALRRSDYDGADELYRQALPLYRGAGDLLGEANCIQSLGEVAFDRSNYESARELYEQSIPIFRGIGDTLGEANSIKRLGDLALHRSDQRDADKLFQQALPLYRRVGSLLGEGHCVLSLGDLSVRVSDIKRARRLYYEALGFYERYQEPYSIAKAHIALAKVAQDDRERRHHIEAASEAFSRIQRSDLAELFGREFGIEQNEMKTRTRKRHGRAQKHSPS